MMELNFGSTFNDVEHLCESYRDGDWIIFRCPQCLEYERRMNPRTGEMITKNIRPEIRHVGSHLPLELKSALENLN
jgi:hypothetical protein